jgi:hypothetical protein
MVFEEQLFNFGVSGVMLAYFIYDKINFQKEMLKVVQNNTIALTKFYESLRR